MISIIGLVLGAFFALEILTSVLLSLLIIKLYNEHSINR